MDDGLRRPDCQSRPENRHRTLPSVECRAWGIPSGQCPTSKFAIIPRSTYLKVKYGIELPLSVAHVMTETLANPSRSGFLGTGFGSLVFSGRCASLGIRLGIANPRLCLVMGAEQWMVWPAPHEELILREAVTTLPLALTNYAQAGVSLQLRCSSLAPICNVDRHAD
jgi:hypothetical protein